MENDKMLDEQETRDLLNATASYDDGKQGERRRIRLWLEERKRANAQVVIIDELLYFLDNG